MGDEAPQAYTDFRIEFVSGPEGGWPRVRASCRDSEVTAEAPFPLDPERVGELVPQVELAAYGQQASGTRISEWLGVDDVEDEADAETLRLESVGHDLFEAALGGKIGTYYALRRQDSGPLRIRVKLDLEDPAQRVLSRLPWECLKETEDDDLLFFGVDHRSPIIRDVAHPDPVQRTAIEGPLRVLVVTANPPGTATLPGIAREEGVIERSFEELVRNGQLEYEHIRDASLEDIDRHLRERADYHVLHFMGHGDYDEKGGRGHLYLHKRDGETETADPVDSAELALSIGTRCEDMRLVVLNACNTAVETRGAGAPHGGVATAMLKGGIPAVIAMQYQIADRAAVRFARTLYRDIVDLVSLEEAVSDARQDILKEEGGTGRTTNFWLTPVLYMRSGATGDVFARVGPTAGDPPPEVDSDADYVVWLTEHRGRLVLNWRVRTKPGYGDMVALFDEEPTDPYGYVGTGWARASEDGRPVEQTRVLETDAPAGTGGYWVAYIRETPDGDQEIVASHGPV